MDRPAGHRYRSSGTGHSRLPIPAFSIPFGGQLWRQGFWPLSAMSSAVTQFLQRGRLNGLTWPVQVTYALLRHKKKKKNRNYFTVPC